jgi:hypothetical protein
MSPYMTDMWLNIDTTSLNIENKVEVGAGRTSLCKR